jgi:hypothetical protein
VAKATLVRLGAREQRLLEAFTAGFDRAAIEAQQGKLRRERAATEAKLARAQMSAEHAAQETKAAKDRAAEVRRMRQGIESADFAGWRRLLEAVVRDVLRGPLKLQADGSLRVT